MPSQKPVEVFTKLMASTGVVFAGTAAGLWSGRVPVVVEIQSSGRLPPLTLLLSPGS